MSSSANPLRAAAVSRWSTLYADALHSIFRFADLKQLFQLARVSRHWSESAISTPSVHATVKVRNDEHLRLLLVSRLRSQVGSLQEISRPTLPSDCTGLVPSYVIRGVELMQLVSTQLFGLHELSVRPFTRYPNEDDLTAVCLALSRMHHLCSLHFVIDSEDCSDAAADAAMHSATNRIIRTIAEIPALHTLHLELPLHSSLSFAPLRALPLLRRLRLSHAPEYLASSVAFSDRQADELRSLTDLHEFDHPESDDVPQHQLRLLKRILQPGHKLQWKRLVKRGETLVVTDPELVPLLAALLTLTALSMFVEEERVEGPNGEEVVPGYVAPSLSLFLPLRQLSALYMGGMCVDYDELTQSIRGCSQITSLTLDNSPVQSRHLDAMLPCFPKLTAVQIVGCSGIDSLRCFDTPALAASLTSLALRWCFNLSSQLQYLLGLRSLVIIEFHGPLMPQAEHIGAFQPRSQRFPQLQSSSVS